MTLLRVFIATIASFFPVVAISDEYSSFTDFIDTNVKDIIGSHDYIKGDVNNDKVDDIVGFVVAKDTTFEKKENQYIQFFVLINNNGRLVLSAKTKKYMDYYPNVGWLELGDIKKSSIFIESHGKTACDYELVRYQFSYKYSWQLIGIEKKDVQTCDEKSIVNVSSLNLLTGLKIVNGQKTHINRVFKKFFLEDFGSSSSTFDDLLSMAFYK